MGFARLRTNPHFHLRVKRVAEEQLAFEGKQPPRGASSHATEGAATVSKELRR